MQYLMYFIVFQLLIASASTLQNTVENTDDQGWHNQLRSRRHSDKLHVESVQGMVDGQDDGSGENIEEDEGDDHHDNDDLHIDQSMDRNVTDMVQDLPDPEDFLASVFSLMNVSGDSMPVVVFEQLLEQLGIGRWNTSRTEVHDELEGDDVQSESDKSRDDLNVHDSRRKKRDSDEESNHTVISQCLSATSILEAYNLSTSAPISPSNLTTLCPALIQQQLSGACNHSNPQEPATTPTTPSPLQKNHQYGFGTLSVLIISLTSILGVFFLTCLGTRVHKYCMGFFVALAMGTLCGDAILHLLPAAYGLHIHTMQYGLQREDDNLITIEAHFYKSVVVLVVIYIFYLLHSIITVVGERRHEAAVKEEEELYMASKQLDLDSHSMRSHNQTQTTRLDSSAPYSTYRTASFDDEYLRPNQRHSIVPSISRFQIDLSNLPKAIRILPKPPVKGHVWLIILTDVAHNFADGLAIGTAFAVSLHGGFSTSLAVLCHEVPHEIGDFAMMLNAGMTMNKTLLANLLSTLAAFIGMFIGTSMSVYMPAREWIYIGISAMFLYIALGGLVHQLVVMHKGLRPGQICGMFILQNMGYVAGVGIMLTIVLFEQKFWETFYGLSE